MLTENATKDQHPMRKLGIVILIAAGLAILSVLVACGSGSPQPTQAQPSVVAPTGGGPTLDGATLLETRCSVCHSVDRPKQVRKTAAQWNETLTRMIAHGAQLSDAEKKVLVDYLAKTYGP